MIIYINQLLVLLTNLISIYIVVDYLNTFMVRRMKSEVVIIGWVIIIIWQISDIFLDIHNVIFNLLLSVSIIFIIAVTLYEGTIYKKIILTVVFNVIWMLAELMTGFLLVQFLGEKVDNMILGSSISKLLMIIIVKVIKMWIKERRIGEIPQIYWSMLLLIPIGSIYIIYQLYNIDIKFLQYEKFLSLEMMYYIIFIINIIIFFLYERLADGYEIQKNNLMFKKQLELCRQNALLQRNIIEKTREIRHDLKYQLFTIKKIIDNRDYDKLQEIIKESTYFQLTDNNEKYLSTTNIMIDSLINYGYAMSKTKNFIFESEIGVDPDILIEDADISLLLGNILDNAIEAVEKVERPGRFISIQIKEIKNTLMIVERNNFNGKLRKDQYGRVTTSKQNNFYHGLGILTIDRIVNKYKGTYIINDYDSVFCIKIVLYL